MAGIAQVWLRLAESTGYGAPWSIREHSGASGSIAEHAGRKTERWRGKLRNIGKHLGTSGDGTGRMAASAREHCAESLLLLRVACEPDPSSLL